MNKWDDMRTILMHYDGDPEVFAAQLTVKRNTNMKPDRIIVALCYLFDNCLNTNAKLATTVQQLNAQLDDLDNGWDGMDEGPAEMTKEDAFAALQMAITMQANKLHSYTDEEL